MADRVSKVKIKGTINEYEQGFLVGFVIFVVGTLLEWVNLSNGIVLPSWPMNVIIGIIFIILLIFLHIFYSSTYLITMFSRVPAAISSIVLFTILVLIMGLTKQNEPDTPLIQKITGFDHVRNSFTFLLSGLYLMITLGLVALRRVTPLNFKNTGFAMNHVGLWIIVFAGSLGAGDVHRLSISLYENHLVWYAIDQRNQPRELPFTLKLIDFTMKEFPPKIAFIERKGMKLKEDVQNNLPLIKEGLEMKTGDWNFKVLKYFPEAVKAGDDFKSVIDTVSSPAALIKIKNDKKGIVREGWISYGNYITPPVYIILDDIYMLAMTKPTPKEYSSKVEVVTKEGKSDTTEILVNKPFKIGGWRLYQLSYDEKLGKYSTLSIIEAIKDPWLPVIYTGIFMVIAGALYLFWIGRNPKT
jgi:hypothetical protein